MQKNITEEGVYSIIKSGFSSFRILAKADLIKYWGKLSREQKCKAARALVKMEDMASIPGFYFSRATTENDYINRIKIWIESNAMNPEKAKNAFYVVWSPLDYVVNSIPTKQESIPTVLATEKIKPVVTETITKSVIEPLVAKEEVYEPKMNQELLNKLLQPETTNVVETHVTPVEEVKPVISTKPNWNEAVINALNIPNVPIYNDVVEYTDNMVQTVVEETIDIPNMNLDKNEVKEEKKIVNPTKELFQMLLRKEDDDNHSLEDYLELKKYLVAQK